MKNAFMYGVFVMIICLTFSVSADDEGRKSLKRDLDCVVVSGGMCGLTGEPVMHYGLFAFQQNKLVPIPFQIDEKSKDGKFVLINGQNAGKDEDNGRYDNNDELAFMAMDTGDRIPGKTVLPENYKACAEIEVTDPVSNERAWVYLVSFDTPRQRCPNIDYVSYNPEKLTITTRNYTVGYNKKHLVAPSKIAFEKGLGGNGEDLIDRSKVRIKIKLMAVRINRSEEDIIVEEKGYIDGPVRVIIHTGNTTPLALGISASSTEQYLYYYDKYADFAFAVSFPIKPGSFRATIHDDFLDAGGWTFYNNNISSGQVIDGKMGDDDKALDRSPWTWSVLTKDDLSLWALLLSPPGCPVKASLYYNDDKEAEDEMEDHEGEVPGVGYDFNIGWKKLKEKLVEFRIVHFFTRGFQKGMEADIQNVYERPLKAVSTRL